LKFRRIVQSDVQVFYINFVFINYIHFIMPLVMVAII